MTAADVQKMAKKLLDTEKMVVLAVGKASEVEAGDPDHPGALKDVGEAPARARAAPRPARRSSRFPDACARRGSHEAPPPGRRRIGPPAFAGEQKGVRPGMVAVVQTAGVDLVIPAPA